jgi:uncharacterized protein YhaN
MATLAELAGYADETFEVARKPEKFVYHLEKNRQGYALSITEKKTNETRTIEISSEKNKQLLEDNQFKNLYDEVDKKFMQIRETEEKEKTERRSRIKRRMKKGLIGFLAGIGLTAGSLLGYTNSNFVESPEHRELDRKAKAITPKSSWMTDSGKYEIEGENVEVYRTSKPPQALNIKVNGNTNFESQEFFAPITSDGDARNLSSVSIYANRQWEEIENPEKFQETYERLIEKVYEAREAGIARAELKEMAKKPRQELEDLADKF